MTPHQALLVIDAQVNMFDEACSIFDGTRLMTTLQRLIEHARTQRSPVIYIRHNGGQVIPTN